MDETVVFDVLDAVLARLDARWLPAGDGARDVDRERGGITRIAASRLDERRRQVETYYRAHRRDLGAQARRSLGFGREDVAEDVVHEAILKVWTNPPEPREVDGLARYISTAVRREALDRRTSAGREHGRRVADGDEALSRLSDSRNAPDRVLLQMVLARAIATLSPRERDLIVLVEIERCTVPVAAQRLGIGLNTAKRYRADARARLRDHPDVAELCSSR